MDAEELRRRRRALGISQLELGKRLGEPQQTIARWESGKRRITHPGMLRLALERLAMGEDRDGTRYGRDCECGVGNVAESE